ncbi:MAG TPA: hypothetical protein VMU03_16475 [Gammaproteobacteria bacterium]|nr:hypothetical protein [Gammaproteobacteria bacterium]
MLLVAGAHAQHAAAGVSGTWHVAVPGWGIEDHLLVVQEHDGAVAGKFEFADVKGTVAGTRVQFDVIDEGGRLALHFRGTISGDRMQGEVTSPPDGPLAQHGVADPLTTAWTAGRERNKG